MVPFTISEDPTDQRRVRAIYMLMAGGVEAVGKKSICPSSNRGYVLLSRPSGQNPHRVDLKLKGESEYTGR